jgi:hypothetical protein
MKMKMKMKKRHQSDEELEGEQHTSQEKARTLTHLYSLSC